MAVLLMYNAQDSYTVEQIHEHTQIKMVGSFEMYKRCNFFNRENNLVHAMKYIGIKFISKYLKKIYNYSIDCVLNLH